MEKPGGEKQVLCDLIMQGCEQGRLTEAESGIVLPAADEVCMRIGHTLSVRQKG